MPLESAIPRIDDRRYDDIVAELRTRIARYTPEWSPVWTDVNDSDPGVTMVQLFAWLAEMLLYRMNRVPELNYLKFLELIGIELNPAQPAQAEITFPVQDKYAQPTVIVPMHTQVAAQASDGGTPIVFETERALIALTAQLQSLQSYDGYAYTDLTSENADATQGFEPFGSLARDDSALLLGFAYASGSSLTDMPAQTELNLAMWAASESGPMSPCLCGPGNTLASAPASITWEYWSGTGWEALTLLKDETRAFTRSGHVYLKTPAAKSIAPATIGAATTACFWIRARVEQGQYERPPKLLAVRTNTVAALQAETVADEVLGGSNGRPNQVFQLANRPVVSGTLKLEVDEGDGYQQWTPVSDFFGSGAADRVYVLNATSGQVLFGDGLHGGIPVSNVDNPDANVVAREYRFGGGARGNVAAGAIKTLRTSITGVDESKVSNLQAAVAGRDEESLAEAKQRAPRSLKSRNRAVTPEDFEFLAAQAATIKRARALPLAHPSFPGVKVPGTVTVIVVPDSDAPNPLPSEATLRAVCAYLDKRRLLTTEVYVVPPTYQLVQVRGQVVVDNNSDLADVKQEIEKSLLDYFHPLKGGADGQGWPFGGTIYYSSVYQRVFSVKGVQSVTSLTIVLDGEEMPECKDVPIKEGALLYSTEHAVAVQYQVEQ